jgi:hypothetical protein
LAAKDQNCVFNPTEEFQPFGIFGVQYQKLINGENLVLKDLQKAFLLENTVGNIVNEISTDVA